MTGVRKPAWWERLHFKAFGVWPQSYVDARLDAVRRDEERDEVRARAHARPRGNVDVKRG